MIVFRFASRLTLALSTVPKSCRYILKIMKHHWSLLLSWCLFAFCQCLFASCGSSVDENFVPPISSDRMRGEVVLADINNSKVTARVVALGDEISTKFPELVSGKEFAFQVESGDFGYLSKGRIFIANADIVPSEKSTQQTYKLSSIWPDEPQLRRRFQYSNRMLRRDTLSRGDDPTRTIGDYLPPFALYDQNGNMLTSDFFNGKLTVMNFIFTRCSIAEMCPASTIRMRRLQNLVYAEELSQVQFLSLTLDPVHDTPGVLKSYSAGYEIDEKNFSFATGPKPVIEDLVRQFGISRRKTDVLPLDHTMRTILVNKQRQIVYQVPGKGWSVDDFLDRIKQYLPAQ